MWERDIDIDVGVNSNEKEGWHDIDLDISSEAIKAILAVDKAWSKITVHQPLCDDNLERLNELVDDGVFDNVEIIVVNPINLSSEWRIELESLDLPLCYVDDRWEVLSETRIGGIKGQILEDYYNEE